MRHYKLWTEQEDEYLKTNYLNFKYSDIAKNLGKNVNSVFYRASHLNLIKYKKWSKSEIDFLKDNYLTLTDNEISILLNKNSKYVKQTRRNLKLKKFDKHRLKIYNNHFNEHFTTYKAYILGVIFGDGNISKYRIKLDVIDEDFAIEFKQKIEFAYKKEASIISYINSANNKSYIVSLYSVPAINNILKFKNVPFIQSLNNTRLIIPFLKGLYDSECCVHYYIDNGYTKRRIAFTNTNYDLILLVHNLLKKLGINSVIQKSVRIKTKDVYNVNIANFFDILKFYMLINFIIRRKKEKLENVVDNIKECFNLLIPLQNGYNTMGKLRSKNGYL